ncbi:hypothetical protein ACYOEI_21945 [Singulisphaera rosea]
MSEGRDFETQLAEVRPATKNLVAAILIDVWPSAGVIVDFGLDSQEHYEALYYPIRQGEISPKVLDAALGDGQKLTELVRAAPSNPHKEIAFLTSWDVVFGRAVEGAGAGDGAARDGGLEISGNDRRQGGNDGPEKRRRR